MAERSGQDLDRLLIKYILNLILKNLTNSMIVNYNQQQRFRGAVHLQNVTDKERAALLALRGHSVNLSYWQLFLFCGLVGYSLAPLCSLIEHNGYFWTVAIPASHI